MVLFNDDAVTLRCDVKVLIFVSSEKQHILGKVKSSFFQVTCMCRRFTGSRLIFTLDEVRGHE